MQPAPIDPERCDFNVTRGSGNMTHFGQCKHKWKYEYKEHSDGPTLRRCRLHHSSEIAAREKEHRERFNNQPELVQLRVIERQHQQINELGDKVLHLEREKRELENELDGLRATMQYARCAGCGHKPHYDACTLQRSVIADSFIQTCNCQFPRGMRAREALTSELAKPIEERADGGQNRPSVRRCERDWSLIQPVRQVSADGVRTFEQCSYGHRFNEQFEPRMCATCHTTPVTNQYSTECEPCRLRSREINERQSSAVSVEPDAQRMRTQITKPEPS